MAGVGKNNHHNDEHELSAIASQFFPYRDIEGGLLLDFFQLFPCKNEQLNELVVQKVFYALATTSSIIFTIDVSSKNRILKMQSSLSNGSFDRYVHNADYTQDVNNCYAENARKLLLIPMSFKSEKPIFISLEKGMPCFEGKLIGYEIELGVYFEDFNLSPHFILAETLQSPHLGWPLFSIQIDRMPKRAPQIELVIGPLDPVTRKKSDYFNAVNNVKQCFFECRSIVGFVERYNASVSEDFKLVLSVDCLEYIEQYGDLRYTLAYPQKSTLIVSNVQTTIQVPYSSFAKSGGELDRLFKLDEKMANLLSEVRLFADEVFADAVTKNFDFIKCKSIFVHVFFELIANLINGRNEFNDFKDKAPFIIRTRPESISPYICSENDAEATKRAFAKKDIILGWLCNYLRRQAGGVNINRFLSDEGQYEVNALVSSKLALIEQRLDMTKKLGSYLSTIAGYIPSHDGDVIWINKTISQTKNLPPTVINSEYYVAIELRNKPAFLGFHRSHQGTAPIELSLQETHHASKLDVMKNIQFSSSINPDCIPCEQYNCWIEIDVRDEQNRSFKGQKATLTDATGTSKTVTLKDGPTLVQGFAVGPVTVKLETQPWLKAAQSREALKEGETSQVPAYTEKFWGHCDVKRKHVKVTTGDLCLTDPEQPLPEGHKAGAQPPRFITKHSYVIEVKGYQLNILRIGVFFDGTANNTTKHEEGKAALEAFLAQCSDPLEQERMRQQCMAGEVSFSDTSQANDVTNIGKAYELYQLPQQGRLTVPVYIDGIGTESGQGDSKLIGQGMDGGATSSYGKVMLACREKIVNEVKRILKDVLPTLGCIHKLEFDVFGFSRGASAARQFVNTLDQQADHPLVEAVAKETSIRLKAGFDWASREDCRIKFVGLFDTVCSSLLEERSVTLAPDCAERVVHLTAKDEWRYFFALTRITNDVEGKKIASNFTELALPGCHSDIGGGYYSRWSLRNPNSDPALTEQKAIKLFQSMEPAGSRPEQSVAYQRAMDYAQAKLSQGWGNGVTVLPSPASDPVKGKLNLRVRTLNRPEFGWKRPLEVSVTVLINRVIEGEYSRIPLHVMVEAARAAGVPFREWDKTDKALMLESGAPMRPRVDLSKLDEHWVNAGSEAGVAKDLSQQLPDDVYRYLRFEYLHHSADDGIVNGANRIKGQEARRMISNLEGGK